eukprot:5377996-Pyramimonas_sp.AAC.1
MRLTAGGGRALPSCPELIARISDMTEGAIWREKGVAPLRPARGVHIGYARRSGGGSGRDRR